MNTETTTVRRARVIWDHEDTDIRAHTVELADQRIAASSAPEFGGNPEKADPEEMFVASLSTPGAAGAGGMGGGARYRCP